MRAIRRSNIGFERPSSDYSFFYASLRLTILPQVIITASSSTTLITPHPSARLSQNTRTTTKYANRPERLLQFEHCFTLAWDWNLWLDSATKTSYSARCHLGLESRFSGTKSMYHILPWFFLCYVEDLCCMLNPRVRIHVISAFDLQIKLLLLVCSPVKFLSASASHTGFPPKFSFLLSRRKSGSYTIILKHEFLETKLVVLSQHCCASTFSKQNNLLR